MDEPHNIDDQLPTMQPQPQSTPMALKTSSTRSFSNHSRDDICNFLKEELARSTELVTADSFLRFANLQTLWDSTEWSKMVTKLTDDETQQQLKRGWHGIPNETDQYKPFCDWVEHLIPFITELPNQPSARKIRFLPWGNKNLGCTPGFLGGEEVPGTASAFRPDVVCIPSDVTDFGKWSQVLVPMEFKKKKSSSTARGNAAPSTSGTPTLEVPPTPSTSHSRSDLKRSRPEDDESAGQEKKARTSTAYPTHRFESLATPSSSPAGSSHSPTLDDLQLARYAMETLAAVGDRTHVFGLVVKFPGVALWYFDRCGAVCTSALNLDTSEGFLPFLKFLSALVYMGDDALGFNPFFADSSNTTAAGIRKGLQDLTVNIPDYNDTSLKLLKELDRRTGLVGRATLVWKAQLRENGGESGGTARDVVIKSSWQHSARKPEWEILSELHEQDQARNHIVHCFHGWEQPGATGSSQRVRFGQPAAHIVDDRALRHTVLEYLNPITELSQPFHIPSIGWNIMQAINFLNDMQWYHRDISIGNMGFSIHPDCGGVLIKLHDFDLSKHHSSNSGAPHWTGTLPFMSIELLEQPTVEHKIGFEVEALIWTLLWIVRVYANGVDENKPADHPLRTWFTHGNNLESLAAAKMRYLQMLVGYTNEFYGELEVDMADLAFQWHDMRNDQLKERRRKNKPKLLSESLYEMPGFITIQEWMTEKEWNSPREPCSCGEHCVYLTP
ncbi:hypothetical protein M407DRAFT_23827 [Tulasnella calospora MUT 4182]|uniref:Protein kinase domain-containing protein n=1 Tax=Tulasnella calospora MUT 4182 TaxID=1051891 RepID=A0A0C3KZT1_9AGAM|nr:hypothetical protein M407DRAFT_23827 [Tulasnella calospora MUT 4182]